MFVYLHLLKLVVVPFHRYIGSIGYSFHVPVGGSDNLKTDNHCTVRSAVKWFITFRTKYTQKWIWGGASWLLDKKWPEDDFSQNPKQILSYQLLYVPNWNMVLGKLARIVGPQGPVCLCCCLHILSVNYQQELPWFLLVWIFSPH